MSSKLYRYKVIEATDPAELEARLAAAGTDEWSAVGYGVLPDGRRSVLLSRKVKVHDHGHRKHGHPNHSRRGEERALADRGRATE